ncbi:hypothetical protein [Luteimonas fraxinea]|uniref:hypothetical protein n=1 Tax=Luteimonas fraxinea TaxID=2901869 RepID=UPI001E3120DC|nr:hypothetical protein [Luteimonas fraxinea]MCD9126368.1 hypothetical protein [Luteimonas fraxinea]
MSAIIERGIVPRLQPSVPCMPVLEIALFNALAMLDEGLAPTEEPLYETLAKAGLAHADFPRLTRAGRDLFDALRLHHAPVQSRRL